MNEKANVYLVPLSIILAGGLIALGIFFSGRGGSAEKASGNVLGKDLYVKFAKNVGIKEKDFLGCFEKNETLAAVSENVDEAIALNINGTPTSFIVNREGKVLAPINGAQSFEAVKQALETAQKAIPEKDARSVKAVSSEIDFIRGAENPELFVVEFSDFQCPYCKTFHPTMKKIVEENKDIAWVYRHLPLTQIHPEAQNAAVAAECVGKLKGSDAFWKYADALFGA